MKLGKMLCGERTTIGGKKRRLVTDDDWTLVNEAAGRASQSSNNDKDKLAELQQQMDALRAEMSKAFFLPCACLYLSSALLQLVSASEHSKLL